MSKKRHAHGRKLQQPRTDPCYHELRVDNLMSSVGESLRRERLRAGLDLNQIARDTKISTRTLELIEANQFEKLPGGVFARSFVRQYARAVGVDEEEILRELERVLEPAPPPLPTVEEIARHDVKVQRMPRWSRFRGTFGGSRKGLFANSSLPALVLVVLVIVACSGAYSWWQQARRAPTVSAQQQAVVEKPAAVPVPAPQANRSAETNTAAVAVASAAPVEPAPAPQPVSGAAADANGSSAVHLALTAAEATWVQARANGKVVFSGILQPNETKSLEAADTVTLKIGNAGGLSISFNGKSIPQVGPKGQVRVVSLSPDGAVQVEEPKPSPPPQTQSQTETL